MGTEAWRSRGENFQLDLMEMANLRASGSWREVQDAVSKNWQPRETCHGMAPGLHMFNTRCKTIGHYRDVRDIAAEAVEDELAQDEGDAHTRIRELGEAYAVAFNADAKEGARAAAEEAVHAIAAKIKHAMAAADFENLDAAIEAFSNAGLEAMQAFKSAAKQHYDAGAVGGDSCQDASETRSKTEAQDENGVQATTCAGCKRKAAAQDQNSV